MSRIDTVRPVRTAAARAAPPYFWLGADAERIAVPVTRTTPRPRRTIPLYQWLGADAEGMAASRS